MMDTRNAYLVSTRRQRELLADASDRIVAAAPPRRRSLIARIRGVYSPRYLDFTPGVSGYPY